ncbi:hypothetical protein NONI108955_41875 [Nocardia ninae]|uniref:Uncharacterized protein n=1 Tax=Nocardia ninae NBRC 108245 TaxID=1210091 RepID=A0A511MT05_9NOCA|nr:hypothetical protein [Nocardia ninae]GEM43715.1 hypothetical protein NN4_82340 [Nocardia ninae NBRC 108245]
MQSDELNYDDGEQWRCAECGHVDTIEWDDELEQTVGLPDVVAGDNGEVTLLCSECSFDAC